MTSSTSVHQSAGPVGHVVVGLLPDMNAVRQTLQTLRSHGVSDEQIGLAMRQADSEVPSIEETSSPTVQDAATGAVGGGILGGLAGLLTATGIVAIPGLAPLLAGGALVSLLGATGASIIAGSGVGAVAGGLVGALISINVPETAARQYDEAVRQGKILITVKTDGDTARIQKMLELHGAETGLRS
ncbi:MAG: hypothetical protein M3M98_03425 [Nitrospirota bacterium]|nr:hypothetical protein [Nitrospirota bacterium]